mgnify:CR=1 FL=1
MPEFPHAVLAFAGYLAAAGGFTVLFVLIYTRLTPHREFDLIVHEHNVSAAVALCGSLVGFAIPLARAMSQAVSIGEFAAWAVVALVVQVAAYWIARLAHHGLSEAIADNTVSAALWLASVSLTAGLLSAAAMTG